MASVMAAMLDELMGKDRDLLPDEKPKGPHWDDESVCRSYLCGFCPHDLFTNTKSDLGQCPKKHEDRLREKYEQSARFQKCGYENAFLSYLERIVEDMDRKIKRGRQRLANNTAYREKVVIDEGNDAAGNQDIARIEDTIEKLLSEVESLGQQGEVDEAQNVMRKIDQLKREKEKKQFSNHRADLDDYEKRMEVCDTCGAFLVINDTQIRLDAHLSGKQHLGFTKVRAKIDDLKKMLKPSGSSSSSSSRGGSDRRRDSYNDRDSRRDYDRDSRRDSRRDYDRDSRRDYDRDSRRDSDRDSRRDSDRYRGRDRDHNSDRDRGRDSSDRGRYGGDYSDRRRDSGSRYDRRDRDRSDRRSRSRERLDRHQSHRSPSRERQRDSEERQPEHSDSRHRESESKRSQANSDRATDQQDGEQQEEKSAAEPESTDIANVAGTPDV
eukprot:scpid74554/ scgid2566/ Luc7-like protein 3; Cisplatin resistance-associated-overexpressed protein